MFEGWRALLKLKIVHDILSWGCFFVQLGTTIGSKWQKGEAHQEYEDSLLPHVDFLGEGLLSIRLDKIHKNNSKKTHFPLLFRNLLMFQKVRGSFYVFLKMKKKDMTHNAIRIALKTFVKNSTTNQGWWLFVPTTLRNFAFVKSSLLFTGFARKLDLDLKSHFYIYKTDSFYVLCHSFMPEPPDQSLPNFAQTSTPTQGRFLIQGWPWQPDPPYQWYPKL